MADETNGAMPATPSVGELIPEEWSQTEFVD